MVCLLRSFDPSPGESRVGRQKPRQLSTCPHVQVKRFCCYFCWCFFAVIFGVVVVFLVDSVVIVVPVVVVVVVVVAVFVV